MNQEDKELLLKDLCARLPYGVKVHAKYIDTDTNTEVEKVGVLSMIDKDTVVAFTNYDTNWYNYVAVHEVKPYLFPLSSMTEEQKKELENMVWSIDDSVINNIIECLGNHRQFVTHFDCLALIEWCYKNHFDINGLIPIGLAIDATGLNIYKNG